MTTPVISQFPGLQAVALEIAYDNGHIHRDCTEEAWLLSLDEVLGAEGVDHADLVAIDQFCAGLSPEEQSTLAAGEMSEADAIAILFTSPEQLQGLLNDIFEN